MKALVVGAYPPMPGPGAAATLARVRELLAEGADVEVVSPVPSAAHRHADPVRVTGSLRLARRLVGAGQVDFFVQPGVLLATGYTGRLPRPRQVIGLALRRARRLRVYVLPVTVALDPASVRAVLGPVRRVVVGSPADREALVAAGLPAAVIEVSDAFRRVGMPPAAAAGGPSTASAATPGRPGGTGGDDGARRDPGPWRLPDSPAREDLQAEIRRRARVRRGAGDGAGDDRAGDHAAGDDGAGDHGAGDGRGDGAGRAVRTGLPGSAASRPLLAIPVLHPTPPTSTRPGVALAKKALRRLLAWQVDPVIDHVNRLHRAAIEAFDAHDAAASRQDRSPKDR